MPSITNPEGEEIVDALGNDGSALMPEQVKRPNPWRKMMMMMMMNKLLNTTKLISQSFNMIKLTDPKHVSVLKLNTYALFHL